MTHAARRVLADCKIALALLEQEVDLSRWRIHWVAALALIRAVGHVLDKVDGRDAAIRKAAKTAYNSWKGGTPEHEIFREFIELERNLILKEYEFNTHPDDEISLVLVTSLERQSDGRPHEMTEMVSLGDNIYRPLMGGFCEGDDARDVLSDAIEWWEGRLEEIDLAAQHSSSP